jgi:hypothetical protein
MRGGSVRTAPTERAGIGSPGSTVKSDDGAEHDYLTEKEGGDKPRLPRTRKRLSGDAVAARHSCTRHDRSLHVGGASSAPLVAARIAAYLR